ncbi:hypothetical protein [Pseudomarimonas arenosa]|uniref:Peptidase MA-like domain-containing protein n=1 Tax=Pseudomarimonas arenosa TaxID=2774145 RepID=A0AAW3ZHQ8_9GAMM|nr:hypothetical protein [Pseudomarimonas arenosa]MBD8524242.1 hypothetical protein [Pseudomarimonas arenosa]
MRLIRGLCVWVLLLGSFRADADAPPGYRVDYRLGFQPDEGLASLAITVTPGSGHLKRLRFKLDPERHAGFAGDGQINVDKTTLTWRPPEDSKATLRFTYQVDRRRGKHEYDARITPEWALFRADRLFPPAATIAPDGAEAKAFLRFDLPQGWTNAELGYQRDQAKDDVFQINNPGRRFQQPLGWVIAGEVGTRREYLPEFEVVVAAPKGDTLRRNDVLAFVISSAEEMRHAFGRLPPKVLIAGAGDPMWRGGLSSPNSLYLHADRPMISENGTSSLLHELVHVITRIRGAKGQDWIAEAFAEFYSIQMLARSGLISDSRADKAYAWMKNHGRKVKSLSAKSSSGPRTARGVTLLADLNKEIEQATGGEQNIDAVTQQLVGKGRITLPQLRDAADQVIGKPSKVLRSSVLDP